MKRLAMVMTVLILAGVCFGAAFSTGWGKIITVENTHCQRFTSFSVNSLSIANRDSTDRVFALVNISTNDFNTRLTAATTVPIDPGMTYTFNADSQTAIQSVVVQSTNGTPEIIIGAF